jgi:hypothetical protein
MSLNQAMNEEDLGGEAIEGEICTICYEPFSKDGKEKEIENENVIKDENVLHRKTERIFVKGCHHQFCQGCLIEHIRYCVSNREMPIKCPASALDNCKNTLVEDQVKDLLCSLGTHISLWARFQRFQRIKADPLLIECCRCQEVVSKDENKTVDGSENQLTCPSCEHSFCSIHGDGHPGKSCEEYDKEKAAKQNRKTEKKIKRITKPCSHCGVPIEKEAGCDHIICPCCDEDMCYRCGTHTYLSGDTIRTCEKCEQNFMDHRHIWTYRLFICLSLPFYIPFCIFYISVMGTLAIATGCWCGFFCCGAELDSSRGKTTYYPMRGFVKVATLILIPALDLFRECGLDCGISIHEEYTRKQTPQTQANDVEKGEISDLDSDDSMENIVERGIHSDLNSDNDDLKRRF